MRHDLKTHYLKITTLSPLHIGTGEVYEPTNFVIDGGRLYEFDEQLFFHALDEMDRKAFVNKLGDWMQIIGYYREKKSDAIALAHFSCPVSARVAERYGAFLNKDGSRNKNQFHIEKVFKNPNSHRPVIPGSSIKGMFDTVLGIYPPVEKDNAKRQDLIVSDAAMIEGGTTVAYSYRMHKDPSKDAKSQIPVIVESVDEGSSFVCSVKSRFSFDELKEYMARYHRERKDSWFEADANSFVARIGKFSGKPYMVADGKNVKNSYGKPVATHTVHEQDARPFGWIRIELISEEAYDTLREVSLSRDAESRKETKARQKDAREKIAALQQARAQEALEKAEEKRLRAEKKAKEEAEAAASAKAEAERLASLSPVDQLIDEHKVDLAILINKMKAGEIDDLDAIKIELAEKIKAELQKEPAKWEKAKKKALNRKEYIESLLN